MALVQRPASGRLQQYSSSSSSNVLSSGSAVTTGRMGVGVNESELYDNIDHRITQIHSLLATLIGMMYCLIFPSISVIQSPRHVPS
jgi:hypothetical protein